MPPAIGWGPESRCLPAISKMPVTFLHTADWQLGKPFASVRDDSKRHRLQQQRLLTVRGLREIAVASSASFIVVAGDAFDSSQASKATVSAACTAIGSLEIPVLMIPGNHDHGGAGSIWQQEFFVREQQQLAPNLKILLEQVPVLLDDAVILPAPLLRRHQPDDPTAWIRSFFTDPSLPEELPRVVLAHGTIQGFGSTADDEDDEPSVANWIDLSRLPAGEIDYVALGDWHGTKQVGAKAWYSGTPEIDRFPKGGSNDPGNILRVTATRNQPPLVEKIPCGRFKWTETSFHFSDDSGLDAWAARMNEWAGSQADENLLRLTLEGTLGIGAAGRLEAILESWESRLVRLKLDHRVIIAPSPEELDALTRRAGDPLISSVASQLVARLDGDPDASALARIALRELHSALAAL